MRKLFGASKNQIMLIEKVRTEAGKIPEKFVESA